MAAHKQLMQTLPDVTEALLLPEGWKLTWPAEQHLWVSKALFTRDASGKLTLTEPLQLWWSPPEPQSVYSEPPLPDPFFYSRLFFWMPCRMWAYRLLCSKPNCRRLGNPLRPRGLYENARKILDMSGWYFMVTECLVCSSCRRKVAGWSQEVLDQLSLDHRGEFPAVLTYRLSCDREVVRLMRGQPLRRGVTELYRHLRVRHKQSWLARSAKYLYVLNKVEDLSAVPAKVPQMIPLPSPSLLLSVYVKDVLTQLGQMKARVTSVYGSILKMTSTEKVNRRHADPGVWTTSVGNELGQVLMCVLTQTEDEALIPMCSGLMDRYQRAGEPPPKLLYLDRDCCSTLGRSKAADLFNEWDQLVIRLDVFQFMHRFSAGVTSERHPYYSLFMGRLFTCIFEWDAEDLERLLEAKQSELEGSQPPTGFLTNAKTSCRPTSKELVRHCRHYTRGAEVTERLIEQMLKDFLTFDREGNTLMDPEKMEEIWRCQRCHLSCIQDSPGVQLYETCGEVIRGGVALPLYRCGRGLASLKAFHEHLNHFIPGTGGNDLNFHACLLDGLVQWNETHTRAADESGSRQSDCFADELQNYVNSLSQTFLGFKLVEDHNSAGEYTGELIGVEYLYSQTSRVLEVDHIMNPDAPDGESEEEPQGDLKDDDFDEDLGFDDHECPKFLELSLKPRQPFEHQAGVLQRSSSQPDPIVSSRFGSIKDESTVMDQFSPLDISQEKNMCVEADGPRHINRKRRQERVVLQQCIDHTSVEVSESLPPVLCDEEEDLRRGQVVDASGQDRCAQAPPPRVQQAAPPRVQQAPATPTNPRVPKTTAWRRRKAEEKAAQRGLPVRQQCEQYVCQKCGQPKTKEFGHSQFRGVHFCAKAAGKTVEQWMREMK